MNKTRKYVTQFVILSFMLIGIITLYNMNAQSTKTITTNEEVTESIPQEEKTVQNNQSKDEKSQAQKNTQSTSENKKETKSAHPSQQNSPENNTQQQNQPQSIINVSVIGVDGVIASDVIEYSNQNAFDVLKTLCSDKGISLKTTGSGITVYVKSIHGLAERDYGIMSGWKYKVNGEYPGVGAGQYQLRENDKVEWVYDKAE